MTTQAPTGLALLRQAFPEHQISLLPKPYKKDSPKGRCAECGGFHGLPAVHLSYVGHAALTDRLLDVDPSWSWEPLALDERGLPAIDKDGGLWIKLTVLGVTRLGYGDAQGKTGGDAMKERIGDALRNAAMRFGAALDLWHKGQLHPPGDEGERGDEDMQDRAKWLADWLAAIDATTNVGECKDTTAKAVEAARACKDADAEGQFMAAQATKMAKAKKAATTKEGA